MKRVFWPYAVLVFAINVLSGCGGGGGSSPTAATYNLRVGNENFLSNPQSFMLTGTATNGDLLTLNWTVTPVGAGIYPLKTPTGQLITSTPGQQIGSTVVIKNGTTELARGTSQIYLTDQLIGLGTARSDGSCTQSSGEQLPTAAGVGQSGSLGTAQIYGTCTLDPNDIVGNITGTWSVETTNSITYACFKTTQNNIAGAPQSTEVDCIEFTPAGSVGTHARVTTSVMGSPVVFSN